MDVVQYIRHRKVCLTRKTKNGRYGSLSPAVEQAAEILKYLASEPRMTVSLTTISKALGINKSKTHILLHALEIAGFVSKNAETKLYTLGLDVIPIGQRALENINYRKLAKPFLEDLARETMCTILFALIRGKSILFLAKETSGLEVDSPISIGESRPLFRRAHGRAILAFLPEEEREGLLSGNKFFSDDDVNFIDNLQIRQDVEECKQNGFAAFRGSVHMIQSIASSVLGHNNYPIGVILAIGLLSESRIPDCGAKLAKAARNFSIVLGMDENEYRKV